MTKRNLVKFAGFTFLIFLFCSCEKTEYLVSDSLKTCDCETVKVVEGFTSYWGYFTTTDTTFAYFTGTPTTIRQYELDGTYYKEENIYDTGIGGGGLIGYQNTTQTRNCMVID